VRADEQKLDRRRSGRTSAREGTKSISIKDHRRKSSGCALTVQGLTPGDLRGVPKGHKPEGLTDQQWVATTAQESAEGIVGVVWHRRPEQYGVASRPCLLETLCKTANQSNWPFTGKLG
jgi:hypothetical protein